MYGTLILVRHGQSIYNEENKFTEESEKKAKELTDQVLNEFKGSKIVDTADDQVASV